MSASFDRKAGRFLAVPVALALAGAALLAPPPAEASYGYATYNAKIKKSGGTAYSVGVKKSKRTGKGEYFIHFMRRVDQCYYTATIQGTGGGQVSLKPDNNKNKRLHVYTFNKNGSPANKKFYLSVTCNR